ncbi:hypothetical protein GCM10022243_10870 [Saccharothrix violaceirubra]|uniref:Guanylate cyclase domain-containing protein n=1 Tax=Saccharothrix violaceirubra TaxID=413306 RepID=A0A7W7T8M2_9PSEU|nr:hypothetical protein [Saccharothrix violaceirubra]MBB4968588.1 hypothetical protein [Saccharothrix violaceirubra]
MNLLALERTVVRVDVVDSSSGGVTRQRHLDRALGTVLDQVVDSVRHSRYADAECFRRDDGDSATLLVGAQVPGAWIASDLMRELTIALHDVNRPVHDDYRLRLRIAVDHGPTVMDPPHVNGEAVVTAARLVDAPALRRFVADERDVDFGLIVSDRFHRDVVLAGERGLGLVRFEPVEVVVKDFRQPAWLQVG